MKTIKNPTIDNNSQKIDERRRVKNPYHRYWECQRNNKTLVMTKNKIKIFHLGGCSCEKCNWQNDIDRTCCNCIHSIVCHSRKKAHDTLESIFANFDDKELTPMLYKEMFNNIFKSIAMTCIEYKEKENKQ